MTAGPRRIRFGDLGLRVLSGLSLAAITLVVLWAGGHWVPGLAVLVTVLMLWELHRMLTGDARLATPALVALSLGGTLAVFATAEFGLAWGGSVLLLGALVVAAVAPAGTRAWLAFGLIYAGGALSYLIVLYASPLHGLPIILWLVLVVVSADVGAYFFGRTVGGPKLWPAISPGKTWAGVFGGLAAAVAVGAAFGLATGRHLPELIALSLGVAIASQLGDLLESGVKRHCGVKDASRLIPGHGGVMDRLDGLLGGLWFFAICDMILSAARG